MKNQLEDSEQSSIKKDKDNMSDEHLDEEVN